jgi:hypothetical protein
MYISKRLLLPMLVVALVASSLVFALAASADGVGSDEASADLLASSLAPSLPSDPTIHGVTPGGAPWALDQGSVRLRADGRVQVRVDGLIIPSLGTAGPVTGIAATLFCGADSNTTPAATTAVAPLSADGDAVIRTTVTLPSTCLEPIVLIQFVTTTPTLQPRYIALTGFMH